MDSEHKFWPHIVKFSGGRSSALMLMTLLHNKQLSAERGDIVLFTNTAAEHPVTYDFVSKMKKVAEAEGIPFFIAEFQTVETVARGRWCRKPTYRLVTDRPYHRDKEPHGYRFRGSVFKEAITWSAMLPSVFTRICTTQMKMLVTRKFLADYLGGLPCKPQQGHTCDTSKINFKEMYRSYTGTMTKAEHNQRWKTLASFPYGCPSQSFEEFSKPAKSYISKAQKRPTGGLRCNLFGEDAVKFLTFLGFRNGEKARYKRMLDRNNGLDTPGYHDHPPGEISYAPLYELGYDQAAVLRFWREQEKAIKPHMPEDINLSNCVYCFLKGPNNLAALHAKKKAFEQTLPETLRKQCRLLKTPNSLSWWHKLDEDNRRRSRKKDGTGRGHFGMFGLNNFTYMDIGKKAKNLVKTQKVRDCDEQPYNSAISCECTD